MVSFSKPQGSSSTAENIPAKRKRILNSNLTDENNVDKEAVKRRKQEVTLLAKKNSYHIVGGSDSDDVPMPPILRKTGSHAANSEAESQSVHDFDDKPKEIPVSDDNLHSCLIEKGFVYNKT